MAQLSDFNLSGQSGSILSSCYVRNTLYVAGSLYEAPTANNMLDKIIKGYDIDLQGARTTPFLAFYDTSWKYAAIPTDISNGVITSIISNSFGVLLIGGFSHSGKPFVKTFNNNMWGDTFFPIVSGEIAALAIDSKGIVYVAGATYVNNKYVTFVKRYSPGWSDYGNLTDISNGVITSIVCDSLDNVYIAGGKTETFNSSIFNFNPFVKNLTTGLLEQFDRKGCITSLAVDVMNDVYVGGVSITGQTYTPFILRKSIGWNPVGPIAELSTGIISSIVFDSAGALYAGGGYAPNPIDIYSSVSYIPTIFVFKESRWNLIKPFSKSGSVNTLTAGLNETIYAGGGTDNVDGALEKIFLTSYTNVKQEIITAKNIKEQAEIATETSKVTVFASDSGITTVDGQAESITVIVPTVKRLPGTSVIKIIIDTTYTLANGDNIYFYGVSGDQFELIIESAPTASAFITLGANNSLIVNGRPIAFGATFNIETYSLQYYGFGSSLLKVLAKQYTTHPKLTKHETAFIVGGSVSFAVAVAGAITVGTRSNKDHNVSTGVGSALLGAGVIAGALLLTEGLRSRNKRIG